MVFLRIKLIKGLPYFYLCESKREGNKVNQKVIRYLGRVKGVDKLEKETIVAVMKRDDYKCKICVTEEDLTIDHIIPLLDGGTNLEDNLQVLCSKCNQVKGRN